MSKLISTITRYSFKRYYHGRFEAYRHSIGYDNNLIYECANQEIMEEFKAYLDSSEVKRIDKLLLWFESAGRNIFLVAEPKFFQDCNDLWIVNSEDIPGFTFKHADGRNLFDEVYENVSSVLSTASL